MKILVIGANGFLGKKAMKIFSEKNEVIGADRIGASREITKVDLTNEEEVRRIIEKYKPEVVFNAAALANVELCEKEKLRAFDVHVKGPLYLAELCKEKNIKLVVVSSDYVFSSSNFPYDETSIPHPISFYGLTKVFMEQAVGYANPDAIIIRPSILYGFNSLEEKDKLITPILDSLKQGEEIEINDFRPKYPVLIDDFVRNVLFLIEKNEKGLFNFASSEAVSRFDAAKIVAKVFGLNEDLVKKGEPKEFKNTPYNVYIINKRLPFLKFVSFEEGAKLVKSQIEKAQNENN